ncbi:hypothetical protein WN48_10186 [Eufriesea mexicana]|nr:hypothetical protein WN48_10186 [Eufriesea mexicana]
MKNENRGNDLCQRECTTDREELFTGWEYGAYRYDRGRAAATRYGNRIVIRCPITVRASNSATMMAVVPVAVPFARKFSRQLSV